MLKIFEILGTISINNSDANRKVDETKGKGEEAAKSLDKTFTSLGKGLVGVGKTMSAVGKTISTYVTAPVVGLGVSTAKTAISFLSLKENTRTAFKVLLGGAEEAEKMLEDLYTFAKTTPFSYDGYLQAGKALVAMGVSAEETIPYLDGITNAAIATGAGQEGINTLSNAIGTMSSKGKIQLNELNQMTAMGIPAVKILANQYKVTEEEMYGLISAGNVMAEEALPLLIQGMNEGTEGAAGMTAAYGGLAQESKNTLSGALDTLRSRFRNVSLEMWNAEEAFPPLNNVIRSFTDLLNYLPGIFNGLAKAAVPALEKLNEKILQLQEFMDKADPSTLEKIGTTILKLAAAGPILLIVGNMVTKLGKTFRVLGNIMKVVQGAGGIGGLITKFLSFMGPAAAVIAVLALLVAALGGPKEALDKLIQFVKWLGEQLNIAKEIIADKFAPVLEHAKDTFAKLAEGLGDVINWLGGLIGALTENIDFWGIFEASIGFVAGAFDGLLSVIDFLVDGIRSVVEWGKEHETIMTAIGIAVGILTAAIVAYNVAAAIKRAGGIAEIAQLGILAVQLGALTVVQAAQTVATTVATAAASAYGAVMTFITSPITLVIAAIAALIAIGVLLYKNWDKVKETLLNIFNNLRDRVVSIFNSIKDTVMTVFETIKNVITVAIMFIVEIITAAFQLITLPFRFIWENCKDIIIEVWEVISGAISAAIDFIAGIIETVFTAISDFLSGIWEAVSTKVMEVWTAVSEFFSSIFTTIQSIFTEIFSAIADFLSSIWEAISSKVSAVWNAIRETISNVINTVRDVVSNVINDVKDRISNVFSTIGNIAKNTWNAIKTAITTPIEKARDTVKNVIDKIKGFFNFEWSLPKLKMPHLKIDGEFSLMPPSVPKFGIDWYAKGGIMTEPTLFDYNPMSGRAKVGGEAGDEAIAPIDTLLGYVRTAVAEQTGDLAYAFEKMLSLLAEYLPMLAENADRQIVLNDGTLVGELAPKIDRELGMISKRKG